MNCKKLKHNILGRYCWTCRLRTEIGIPGWPKAHKGNGVSYKLWDSNEAGGYATAVTWKNGDQETKRALYKGCFVCGKHCSYPVSDGVTNNYDGYYQISKSRLS